MSDLFSQDLLTQNYMYNRAGKFHCKNIFMVCVNHENILQQIIITVSTFQTHGFTAQLASYFTRDGLFFDIYPQVTCGKRVTTFLVSDKMVRLYCHSTYLQHFPVLFCTQVVCPQLHVATNAAHFLGMCSLVCDH